MRETRLLDHETPETVSDENDGSVLGLLFSFPVESIQQRLGSMVNARDRFAERCGRIVSIRHDSGIDAGISQLVWEKVSKPEFPIFVRPCFFPVAPESMHGDDAEDVRTSTKTSLAGSLTRYRSFDSACRSGIRRDQRPIHLAMCIVVS